MKKANQFSSKPSDIIDPAIEKVMTKTEMITKIYEDYISFFYSSSAKKGRVNEKQDDVHDFFEQKICDLEPADLYPILFEDYGIALVRRMYICFLIDKIRKETSRKKGIISIVIEEISRDEQAIANIYDFINQEEISRLRGIIMDNFRAPKYLEIFNLMIKQNTNKEIQEITGYTYSSVGITRHRIVKELRNHI